MSIRRFDRQHTDPCAGRARSDRGARAPPRSQPLARRRSCRPTTPPTSRRTCSTARSTRSGRSATPSSSVAPSPRWPNSDAERRTGLQPHLPRRVRRDDRCHQPQLRPGAEQLRHHGHPVGRPGLDLHRWRLQHGQRRRTVARSPASTWPTARSSPAFNANGVNGVVKDLRLVGNDLYIAGSFTAVGLGNQPRTRLASLNPTTGAVTTKLNVAIAGTHNGGTTSVYKFDVTPAGDEMMIIGNFTHRRRPGPATRSRCST